MKTTTTVQLFVTLTVDRRPWPETPDATLHDFWAHQRELADKKVVDFIAMVRNTGTEIETSGAYSLQIASHEEIDR